MRLTSWENAREVLCVRLDALGDVLMTTPAIRALAQSGPGRRVALLTSAGGARIAKLVPEIDQTIVYEAPWVKSTAPRQDSLLDRDMIARLRQGRFDAAVIFTVYSQSPLPSALMCFLAGIPLRLAHCHENPYQLLTDWVADPEPARFVRHEVRRQLDLVSVIGSRTSDERMSLRVRPRVIDAVSASLWETGLDLSRPFVVVHPGATAQSRRYPPASFALVARHLVSHGCPVVFTGAAEEGALIDEIRDAMNAPALSLAGRLSLEELAALILLAPLLVSNNTGPVHMAAALGTPVVDLYALTNPQHTPWMVPSRVLFHDVPCRYCYRSVCPEGHNNCLRLVEPERVVSAALELLETEREDRIPAMPPISHVAGSPTAIDILD